MINGTNILDLAASMARYAAQRHTVIADNIAHADTPGYQSKDLRPFADIYEDVGLDSKAMQAENFKTQISSSPNTLSPNGNSVSLEEQMMHSAQVQNDHALSLLIYKKSLDLMKLAVGKNL